MPILIKKLGLFLLIIPLLASHATAQIINVPADQPSIQAGIDVARYGDTVLVAEGTYFENISFKGKAITVASHFIIDSDTSHISRTIINGSRPVNVDYAPTVQMTSGEDTTSVLSGLCITGGTGTLLENGDVFHRCGGGVHIKQCGGKIEHNLIVHNHINSDRVMVTGGGICAGVGAEHNLVIRRNTIKENTVQSRWEADAAGIVVADAYRAKIIVEYNRITNNRAISTVSNHAHGGGMTMAVGLSSHSDFMVRRNVISYNELHINPEIETYNVYGAGINVFYFEPMDGRIDIVLHPTPVICENIISHNISVNWGGGISVTRVTNSYPDAPVCPQPLIIHNTITDNYALGGSGLRNLNACLLLLNNTFRNDLSAEGSGELYNDNPAYYRSNQGYINAYNNDIQGDWKNGKNIRYKDYPKVFSISHTWKANVSDTGTISFRLLPPIWRRWWAYACYGSFILFLLLLYRRFLTKRAKLRTALEVERIEKQKIQEIEQMKSRFFANISHEFRTPLTLLLGPLHDLLKNRPDLDGEDRKLFRMMRGNAEKLQQLINQLLDLSKLESGNVKLQVSEGNITELLNRIVTSFLSLAESKKIGYEYDLPVTSGSVYYDGDKLEKILINLLSNAFKFTPEGGNIHVSAQYITKENNDHPNCLKLTIQDSGSGIPADQIDKIFDRFYQVSSSDSRLAEGTGIGLSLTRELVNLYRGEIKVESEPGTGSKFTVELPVTKDQFREDEIVSSTIIEPGITEVDDYGRFAEDLQEVETGENQFADKDGSIILIVEDNADLRKYIARNLDPSYQIIVAENGSQGLKKAIETIPDLVISDLMMPVMDGMEMFEHLKSDERTSHIPVIMLTAKADRSSKLEGLKKGADDYIIKPFDAEELQVRVANLIEQRESLRKHYREGFLTDSVKEYVTPAEKEFLQKTVECIHQHLSEPEYNVDQLGKEMGLSRMHLYRKIIALTDHSPVEFLRNIRLKFAARLFQEGHKNIAQVMYQAGFNTPSHFAQCFRQLYGLNPSEYIRKLSSS